MKSVNGIIIISEEQSFLLAHLTFIISGVRWIFDLPWCKRNKRSSLKIKSLKTTSKCRSAARAVRPSSSTRGLLPLYFFVVFLCFLFKGGEKRGYMNVYWCYGNWVWNFCFAPVLKGVENLEYDFASSLYEDFNKWCYYLFFYNIVLLKNTLFF